MNDIRELSKIQKARNLRYKKAIADGFNLESIQSELYDISEACSDIRWIKDGDEDTLINAFNGDEEEAFEFRVMFSDLDSECEQLYNMLRDEYVVECFDDFFCRVAGGCVNILGYDAIEEDYFAMTRYECTLAQNESEKRILRLTKSEILVAAEQCFGVASAFLNIRYKYDYLKSAFDIIRDENTSVLELIKDIEKAYDKAMSEGEYSKTYNDFDNLIKSLPSKTWLE